MTLRSEDSEALHRLMDGQLAADERAELLLRVETDRKLATELCRLRHLKDSVSLAYEEIPTAPPRSRAHTPRHKIWPSLVASLLLLMAGLTAGWQLKGLIEPNRLVLIDSEGRAQQPALAENQETRIVFHVTRPDETDAQDLLDEVEQMLVSYFNEQHPLRIEIVTHGEGLALLRSRLSTQRERINQLAKNHQNLSFVACRNTIERLRVEQGVEVVLLPEATLTESGVAHVIHRQQQGWTYIRV